VATFTRCKSKLSDLSKPVLLLSDPDKHLSELSAAITEAQRFKFDGPELKQAVEYRDSLQALHKQAADAWAAMDEKKMRVVSAAAKQQKVKFPLVADINTALNLLDGPTRDEKAFLNMKLQMVCVLLCCGRGRVSCSDGCSRSLFLDE
jgi:hypothetical protein